MVPSMAKKTKSPKKLLNTFSRHTAVWKQLDVAAAILSHERHLATFFCIASYRKL